MTFYEAAAQLGLPAYARLTMFSHADQDACARLTGQKPHYQRLAEEHARHIRETYTRPDFHTLWTMNPLGLPFPQWLQQKLEHETAASNNPHMSRRDRDLSKFLALRLREALDNLDHPTLP
jgi:hypothetical protein